MRNFIGAPVYYFRPPYREIETEPAVRLPLNRLTSNQTYPHHSRSSSSPSMRASDRARFPRLLRPYADIPRREFAECSCENDHRPNVATARTAAPATKHMRRLGGHAPKRCASLLVETDSSFRIDIRNLTSWPRCCWFGGRCSAHSVSSC